MCNSQDDEINMEEIERYMFCGGESVMTEDDLWEEEFSKLLEQISLPKCGNLHHVESVKKTDA